MDYFLSKISKTDLKRILKTEGFRGDFKKSKKKKTTPFKKESTWLYVNKGKYASIKNDNVLDALLWNDLQVISLNEKQSQVQRAVLILPYTTLPFVCSQDCVYVCMRGYMCVCLHI